MAYEFYGQDWEKQEPPENWHKQAIKEKGYFLEAQAIVGECVLSDIVTGSTDDFAEPDCYHWILTDPLFYKGAEIRKSVAGHLRLWEYDIA
jgi:hypothetical protein